MSDRVSRRQFISTAGATVTLGLTATDAAAFGRRRVRCHPCPPCPPCPPYPPEPPQPDLLVRPNILSLDGPRLESLRRGVAAMKALPASDPRSWTFQAAIHGTNSTTSNPLFNQCQHGTLQFLTWHRAYIYFFERILRWAAGDPTLMLPYWDWTAAPVVPEPFRVPADTSNPLFDLSRARNDGAGIPASVVDNDLATALGLSTFEPVAGVGFSSSLEGSPHGQVHVVVGGPGGNMSAFETAALDPIFWFHHANVDRVWNRWLNLGGGRVNPADQSFLNQQYSFADETGNTVTVRVGDIISSARLGYRYEDVPSPTATFTTTAAAAGAAAAAPPTPVAATSAEQAEAKPLGFRVERVKLNPVRETRTTLMQQVSGTASPGATRVLVNIEGVSADQVPGYVIGVYVNLPDGDVSAEVRRNHYIGSINFFGKTRANRRKAHGHGQAGGDTFDETFDATAVVARLQQAGRWNPDALSVTFLPEAPLPPAAERAQVAAQAASSAEKANVSYKRVTLRIVSPGR